ncbi:hypothetical protein EPUS_00144 [Endocarpon pusillum Z07020]|uniref:ENTH domain-containing protein n=1 Tax=Endocarpon pusillum (strain Z07020 / HMAS-L-300199) TaxID=1263415 RepID=U1GTK5_ENDPU|nr:uncharacterized protein EPUS_00144 [Endocarpon pusillum Z07020]ERF75351.1 hypothetical protein EPUS_00144 [Endocarpon pusillum Z07020]
MDLNSLRDQVSNLTLYDIKAGVRKVQNGTMSPMERGVRAGLTLVLSNPPQVREATNNEPWGASTSLMQEIANGTHSYQLLNEIMPLIYKRFTDKSAEEWRQIYKSLQLLEFLIKNGSERVIDDARQHVSLLRMLRQFHYIDQNGKDQGVNVRNRAQEIAKLLSDVDSIRAERKKARANRNKAGGVEGGMGIGGGMSSGSRYGGFGSDAGYGGYRGEVYGDGGGFGGNTSGFQDTQRRSDKFEEYDEDEEDGGSSAAKPSAASHARTASGLRAASLNTIKRDAKIKKEPEQDLFEFGDEPAATSASNGKAKMSSPKAADELGAMDSGIGGDDDFDDFQSATTPGLTTEAQSSAIPGLTSPPPAASSAITSSTSFAAPHNVVPPPASNINDLFASLSPTTSSNKPINTSTPSLSMTSSISSLPPPSQATKPVTSGFVSSGPNYYTSVPSTINNSSTTSTTSSVKSPLSSTISPGMGQKQYSSTNTASLGKPNPSTSTSAAGADVFTSLWSSASAKSGIQSRSGTSTPGNKGPDLASMAKAKNEAAMWGTPVGAASGVNGSGGGSGSGGIPPRPSAPTPRTATMGGGQGQGQGQGQQLGGGLDDLLG